MDVVSDWPINNGEVYFLKYLLAKRHKALASSKISFYTVFMSSKCKVQTLRK